MARRKQRTREHIIADLAVNHVERQALLCGFSVETYRHDYGIDLTIHTFDSDGEVEPGSLLVQVKARDSLIPLASTGELTCRLERRDITAWLDQHNPVILAVYDAAADVAYHLHIQDRFQSTETDEDSFPLYPTVRLDPGDPVTPPVLQRYRLLKQRGYHVLP